MLGVQQERRHRGTFRARNPSGPYITFPIRQAGAGLRLANPQRRVSSNARGNRRLLDYLVTGAVVPVTPAGSVHRAWVSRDRRTDTGARFARIGAAPETEITPKVN